MSRNIIHIHLCLTPSCFLYKGVISNLYFVTTVYLVMVYRRYSVDIKHRYISVVRHITVFIGFRILFFYVSNLLYILVKIVIIVTINCDCYYKCNIVCKLVQTMTHLRVNMIVKTVLVIC